MKKVIRFLVILLPWFLSSLLFRSNSFYNKINLPFFALPSFLYGIIWTILYILIAISIYKVIDKYDLKIKEYNKAIIINYIFNQLYTFIFFGIKNLFLAFIDTLFILISSINLYYETKKLDLKAAKLLIPYIIFSGFATILSLTIYFMNL